MKPIENVAVKNIIKKGLQFGWKSLSEPEVVTIKEEIEKVEAENGNDDFIYAFAKDGLDLIRNGTKKKMKAVA